MSKRAELLDRFKEASSIDEYIELVKKALEEPKEIEVAKEILNSAVDECKFPSEFIPVAEMFALLGDNDKAMEVYEEAEDASFEPLEFAQIAKSIFLTTKNQKKAFELIDQAISLAKKSTELLSVLSLITQVSSNTPQLTKIVVKLVEQCKSFEGLQDLVNSVLNELGNKEILRMILVNYERKIQGVENIIEFATMIKKYLEDETWAVIVVEECESEAKFTKEFIALAKYYNSFSQEEKAKEMLNQAQSFATSGEEILSVGFAFWEMFEDSTMIRIAIEKAYKDIKDRKELIRLAEFSSQKLTDKDLTAKILQVIESKSSSIGEFIEFVNVHSKLIDDENQLLNYYSDKQKQLNDPNGLIELGLDLSKRTSNTEKIIPFFSKALENSHNLDQVLNLAEKAKELSLVDIVTSALEKSEVLAKLSSDFLKVGEKYYHLISSTDKAKKCLEIAEKYVASLNDIKAVKELIKKYFADDKDWNERVETKLKKRIEKQNEYDALQKYENELKFIVDYLKLAEDIMLKLDDIYYCRKILQKAEKYLENQPLNIENYLRLVQSILRHTGDANWVQNILVFVLRNKVNLLVEFEMLAKVIYEVIPDKQFSLELIRLYLIEKLNKTDDPNVTLKAIKIYLIYNQIDDKIINLLERLGKNYDIYTSIEVLKLAKKFELKELFERIEKKLFANIKDSNELKTVCDTLSSIDVPKNIIFDRVKEYVNKTNDEIDLVTITENALIFFNDKTFANEIIKYIQKKVSKSKYYYFTKVKNITLERKYW